MRNKGGIAMSWVSMEMGPVGGNGEVVYELGNYKFLKQDGSSVTEGK